jgi:D-arabinose 1-dehydrogenase-like Zn-dependent alcohol dehydrogenase
MDNQVKKLNKWVLIAGLAGGALMTAMLGTASAAPTTTETSESNPPGGGHEQSRLTHMTATITAIDHSDRSLTLKSEEGRETTINVPSDAKVFDTLKVGQKVDIDYYESLAVSLAPSGSKPGMSERRGRAVDMGGGVRGREMMVTAEVVSVDASANAVTFKGPKGKLRTVHVENPTLQEKLPMLKPGQVVQFDYTQATAASIRPSK